MSFATRKDIGRVYVIKMMLPGNVVVHKIGMCHSPRAVDRMMEILRSWFTKYRFIPYTELKLDMEANDPMIIEAHIHKCLGHKKFAQEEKVQGHTEMFTGIDEFRVIQYLKHCGKAQKIKTKLTAEDYKHLGELISP